MPNVNAQSLAAVIYPKLSSSDGKLVTKPTGADTASAVDITRELHRLDGATPAELDVLDWVSKDFARIDAVIVGDKLYTHTVGGGMDLWNDFGSVGK